MKLLEYCTNKWKNEVNRVCARRGSGNNKLRTYRKFKDAFEVEPYVHILMPIYYCSALARFRAGVAPIRIETGRFEHGGVPEDQSIYADCAKQGWSQKNM